MAKVRLFVALEMPKPVKDGVPKADADKLNQEVNPFTGEAMQKALAEVYATPRALAGRAK